MNFPLAVLRSSYWVCSGYATAIILRGKDCSLIHANHIQRGWRGVHHSRMRWKNQTKSPPNNAWLNFVRQVLDFVHPRRCLSEWCFAHCTGSFVCFLLWYQAVSSTAGGSAPGWRSCSTEIPITAYCIMKPNGPAVAERRSGWKTGSVTVKIFTQPIPV